MNPQPDQDLESRLQNLEIELNSSPQPPTVSQPQKPLQPQRDNPQRVPLQLRLINWFNGLSGLRKLMVVGVTAIVGLALLRALLNLFFAVISLAVLGTLMYFGYQFFLARSSKNK